MIPRADPTFLRELKELSPELSVAWDVDLECWVVWFTDPANQKHCLIEWREKSGAFRPLDGRLLNLLRAADMSAKINSPAYIASKLYQKRKEHREKLLQKNRDDRLYKAKQMAPLFEKAADLAMSQKIFSDRQLDRRKIYSTAPFVQTKGHLKLFKKFGLPHLSGDPVIINPS